MPPILSSRYLYGLFRVPDDRSKPCAKNYFYRFGIRWLWIITWQVDNRSVDRNPILFDLPFSLSAWTQEVGKKDKLEHLVDWNSVICVWGYLWMDLNLSKSSPRVWPYSKIVIDQILGVISQIFVKKISFGIYLSCISNSNVFDDAFCSEMNQSIPVHLCIVDQWVPFQRGALDESSRASACLIQSCKLHRWTHILHSDSHRDDMNPRNNWRSLDCEEGCGNSIRKSGQC